MMSASSPSNSVIGSIRGSVGRGRLAGVSAVMDVERTVRRSGNWTRMAAVAEWVAGSSVAAGASAIEAGFAQRVDQRGDAQQADAVQLLVGFG